MKSPLSSRKGIPFYSNKSEEECRNDKYERYDPLVLRQTLLHMADQLWGSYPFNQIQVFIEQQVHGMNPTCIVDIGCGVGRIIADLADRYPKGKCWGLDYSYQMLRQAKSVWVDGGQVLVPARRYGFTSDLMIQAKERSNLTFALCKADQLPFEA